jgi:MFS superfamily sulfate permease-like transporter
MLPIYSRNLRQYPEASEEAGLLLVRLDAPLYFANVQYVRDRLRKYEQRSQVTLSQVCGMLSAYAPAVPSCMLLECRSLVESGM